MYPIGETRLLKLIALDGQQHTGQLLRPPIGCEWLLYWLYGYHTDSLNDRILQWWMYSEERDYSFDLTTSDGVIASGVKHWFMPWKWNQLHPDWGLPMRFTGDCYPYMTAAVAAGTHIEVFGMILERPASLELLKWEWQAEVMGAKLPPGIEALKNRIEYYRGGVG